jgi:hypothetical protein
LILRLRCVACDLLHNPLLRARLTVDASEGRSLRFLEDLDARRRDKMLNSAMLGIFRAAALAGLLVMPAGFAFAEASATPPPSGSTPRSEQPALAQRSSAAQDQGMSRGQQTMNSALSARNI